jgi:hypothetical protein
MKHRSLSIFQGTLLLIIALSFPASAWFVFEAGVDRKLAASVLACIYAFGLYSVFLLPWAAYATKHLNRQEAIQRMIFTWFWVTYITHCSWELGWLLLHEQIINGRDNPLYYLWWAYIDGGDARYATSNPTLIMMEILSVTNGITGLTALFLWFRKKSKLLAILMFMATAIVHLYSTSLYYGSEFLSGLHNINTGNFFDLWIKFILANSPWLIFPVCVLIWGFSELKDYQPQDKD